MSTGRLEGFTLLEVMVGLVVTGLILLVAQKSFEVVVSFSDRLRWEDSTRTSLSLQDDFFYTTFGSADLSAGTGTFVGQEHQISFTTWVESPDGWAERARLSIGWSNGVVTVSGLPWGSTDLTTTDRPLRYQYLADDGRWLDGWESSVETPKAVRILREISEGVDTALFAVGGRR